MWSKPFKGTLNDCKHASGLSHDGVYLRRWTPWIAITNLKNEDGNAIEARKEQNGEGEGVKQEGGCTRQKTLNDQPLFRLIKCVWIKKHLVNMYYRTLLIETMNFLERRQDVKKEGWVWELKRFKRFWKWTQDRERCYDFGCRVTVLDLEIWKSRYRSQATRHQFRDGLLFAIRSWNRNQSWKVQSRWNNEIKKKHVKLQNIFRSTPVEDHRSSPKLSTLWESPG